MRMGGISDPGTPENRYRYNGKEFHDELDLDWYDYGARMLDPSIARWNGVDALANAYSAWSPYNYVMGNPLALVDPDGMRTATAEKMKKFELAKSLGKTIYKAGEDEHSDPQPQKKDEDGIVGHADGSYLPTVSITAQRLPLRISSRNVATVSHDDLKLFDANMASAPLGIGIAYTLTAGTVLNLFAIGPGELANGNLGSGALRMSLSFAAVGGAGGIFRSIFSRSKITGGQASIANRLDDFVELYAKRIRARAPIDGITINGKFYKGGQFIPGPTTKIVYGKGVYNLPPTIPINSLRPWPVQVIPGPSWLRYGVGAVGSALIINRGHQLLYNQHQK